MINKEQYEIVIKNNYIYIKNYFNLENICNNNILICLKDNKLSIRGNNLIIVKLDKYELLIKGTIKGIDFIDE